MTESSTIEFTQRRVDEIQQKGIDLELITAQIDGRFDSRLARSPEYHQMMNSIRNYARAVGIMGGLKL
jgi:hypothetical protein